MKNFVVIMLFTKDYKKVLLVKRNKKPYPICWNGIGGKLEEGETAEQAAIRECLEETGIKIENPRLLVTYIYPENNPVNSGTILNVVYDTTDEVIVQENYEGIYEWKDMDFVMDSNSREIAGYSNLCQFVKEIYDLENIEKFYNIC